MEQTHGDLEAEKYIITHFLVLLGQDDVNNHDTAYCIALLVTPGLGNQIYIKQRFSISALVEMFLKC